MTPRPTKPTEPEPFTGFGPDVVNFWAGLEVDNSKAFWDRHADVFQTQVQRFRAAVGDSRTGPTLVRGVHTAERAGLAVDPGMALPLKTAPRGHPADHPRIDWLRWNGRVAATEIDPEAAGDPEVRGSVLAAWQDSSALVRWLERHVGPTEAEPR